MKIREMGVLVTGVLILTLSGCRDVDYSEKEVKRWLSPDGTFSLELNEDEWMVEEESAGELHFLNLKNEKISFSASRWDGLQFPEGFDYENYYEDYVEDLRLEFSDVIVTGIEIISIEQTEIVQMGVCYEILDELYQVSTSMIAIPETADTLCFVAIYPLGNQKEQERIFRDIIFKIEFFNETQNPESVLPTS